MTDDNRTFLAIGLGTAQDPAAARAGWLGGLAAQIDSACDLLTLEDGFANPGGDGADALLLANWLGARTRRGGILAGAAVNVLEPFHVSTAVATLDYVTEGRAGLLVQPLRGAQVTPAQRAIGPLNGFPTADRNALDADARDAVQVIRALWDSWQDDAIIRDIASQRFVDGTRLHYVDFRGERFNILGPSITPRPPQGQPVVATSLEAGEDTTLAASSDVVFLRAEEAALDALAAPMRASPRPPLLFADVLVSFGRTAGGVWSTPRWEGSPDGLADWADGLRRRARLSGLRFLPADPLRDLEPLLAQLAAVRGADGTAGTLRQRLSLPVAVHRYAEAVSAAA
jgi:alkanesulfonate monooxygenase SsuD/methylene tetrahydromethanopterin reductase-like flavin-dependent oxidoreductase (luciferase family)